jgi:hypothetical protein
MEMEATDFYHELMLKICSVYRLPFNGDALVVGVKDENKAAKYVSNQREPTPSSMKL